MLHHMINKNKAHYIEFKVRFDFNENDEDYIGFSKMCQESNIDFVVTKNKMVIKDNNRLKI